jgi:hypothetical protein
MCLTLDRRASGLIANPEPIHNVCHDQAPSGGLVSTSLCLSGPEKDEHGKEWDRHLSIALGNCLILQLVSVRVETDKLPRFLFAREGRRIEPDNGGVCSLWRLISIAAFKGCNSSSDKLDNVAEGALTEYWSSASPQGLQVCSMG